MLLMSSMLQRRSSALRSSTDVVGLSLLLRRLLECTHDGHVLEVQRRQPDSRVQAQAEDRDDHDHADERGAALTRTHLNSLELVRL